MKNVSITSFTTAILTLLMIMYLVSCDRSKDAEDKQDIAECYSFANDHWSEDDYIDWLIKEYGIDSDTAGFFDEDYNWTYLSHRLPDKKTQQYYEMIGKYEQFSEGWDDYSAATKFSKNRQWYVECLARATQNSKLRPISPE